MAASADVGRRLALCALAALAVAFAGCQTTMDQNERLGLRAERTVESRKPVEVKRAHPDVEVVSAELLRGEKGSAIAVVLRNRGEEIVNDLPIVVGVRGAGGEEILNSSTKTAYFQGHAPAIPAGGEATWVFTTKDDPGEGAAFARVGLAPDPPLAVATEVPGLELSQERSAPRKGAESVAVEVFNPNDIPMYDLEVYAWAERGDRIVAAGRGTLEHLGTGDSAELSFPLVGDARDTKVHVNAPPTFFE